MDKLLLYTIGHGNRKPDEFLFLLKNSELSFLLMFGRNPFQSLIHNSIKVN